MLIYLPINFNVQDTTNTAKLTANMFTSYLTSSNKIDVFKQPARNNGSGKTQHIANHLNVYLVKKLNIIIIFTYVKIVIITRWNDLTAHSEIVN